MREIMNKIYATTRYKRIDKKTAIKKFAKGEKIHLMHPLYSINNQEKVFSREVKFKSEYKVELNIQFDCAILNYSSFYDLEEKYLNVEYYIKIKK